MFKIVEVAERLGKSKTAVYNKLNENQALFKPYLKRVEGIKMIDEQGYSLLVEMFGLTDVETNKEEETERVNDTKVSNDLIELKDQIINELKERINYLESQADKKDELISSQSQQLGQSQVLLQQRQEKILYLEETTKESLWKKLFKKEK